MGVSAGVAGLLCDVASSIISRKAGNKRLYVTFKIKGTIKTSFRYYALFIPKSLRYKLYYRYKTYYITSKGVNFYVK